jgi:hypothetical protein
MSSRDWNQAHTGHKLRALCHYCVHSIYGELRIAGLRLDEEHLNLLKIRQLLQNFWAHLPMRCIEVTHS